MTTIRLVPGDGLRPDGVQDYLGTERANLEPSDTYDLRRGRCYELAGYAVAFGTTPPNVRLVHGSWHGPGAAQRIGHAWVELPDPEHRGLMIWEPIRGVIYPAGPWRAWTQAWDERTYTLPTVRRLLAKSGNYGRWHESRYP